MPLLATVSAAAQRGDFEQARAAEIRLQAFEIPGVEFAREDALVAVAWLRCLEGDTAAARALWAEAIDDSARRGRLVTVVEALHGLARCGLGDGQGTVDPATLRDEVQGPLLTAKLDHADGAFRNEPALLERAAGAFEQIGAALLAAEAFCDASRAHRRAGDQRAATQAMRRGQELASRCPGAQTPALRTSDEVVPLTRRERELALLAADGLSTKEIAERLFLSDRTVQNHLNRAYEKLGVSGRRELRRVLGTPER
jgi:DNA-binding CsgD family transcriptional regulator